MLSQLTAEQRADFITYAQALGTQHRTRTVNGTGKEYDFQRKHCGNIEYRLTRDEQLPQAAWADGINADFGAAQDAKHVGDGGTSFYRPDSLPPFLRERAIADMDDRLQKYKRVVDDEDNPIQGLEIITNDPEAAAFILERMTHLNIPGWVRTENEGEDDG